jgi:phosphoenolpyruvate synthase/pyruvate phosphate dikinase/1-acyl-sn-glycerol-3-phosphate acyltransferase
VKRVGPSLLPTVTSYENKYAASLIRPRRSFVDPRVMSARPDPASVLLSNFRARSSDRAEQIARQESALYDAIRGQRPQTAASPAEVPATAMRSGVGAGRLVFDPAKAREMIERSEPYVFVLRDLTEGALTAAAEADALIVATGRKHDLSPLANLLGKPAVRMKPIELVDLLSVKEVTVDGTRGALHLEKVESFTVQGAREKARDAAVALGARYGTRITSDASSVREIEEAIAAGADELRADIDHLLFAPDVLPLLRRYVLEGEALPRARLGEIIQLRVLDQVRALMRAAKDRPITFAVGTRSPQDFFPADPAELPEVGREIDLPPAEVSKRLDALGSGTSKLNLRGARLDLTRPGLSNLIAKSIFEAYAKEKKEGAEIAQCRILIPSVALSREIELIRERLERVRTRVEADHDVKIPVAYGAGIESAAGALEMPGISQHAEFVEYGLTELTETLLAMSIEDRHRFVGQMIGMGALDADPFVVPDAELLRKILLVGQGVAGGAPNSFPASVRGSLACHPKLMELAIAAGIKSFAVDTDRMPEARVGHALMSAAFESAAGRVDIAAPKMSSQSVRLFELMCRPQAELGMIKLGTIPKKTTPVEHVERLIDEVHASRMTVEQALLEVPTDIVEALMRPIVDPNASVEVLASGIAASPGCGIGRIALSVDEAERYRQAGDPYVLVVNETHDDEIPAVKTAAALVSVRGGETSHAAVIAEANETPCVMNDKVAIDLASKSVKIGMQQLAEGDWITVDGSKGQIILGKAPLLNPADSDAFKVLMQWTDLVKKLKVYANCDTPEQAKRAFALGAEGIGLVRSEHMFFDDDQKLQLLRTILLAKGHEKAVQDALVHAEQAQFEDFLGLLHVAQGRPLKIRLLDPPLYEFLPKDEHELEVTAKSLGIKPDEARRRVKAAQEADSMLGLRGPRLSAKRPEIEAMQVRALARAYLAARAEGAAPESIELTVPMLISGQEMAAIEHRIKAVLAEIEKKEDVQIPLKLLAMVETPSAVMRAGELARHARGFSYGTNDLSQQTLGWGRNDEPAFVPDMVKQKVTPASPSKTLHTRVAQMLSFAEAGGRAERADLETGICGKHAGDFQSIQRAAELGMNYVSPGIGKIAFARLAAAQIEAAKRIGAELEAPKDVDPLRDAAPAAAVVERTLAGLTRFPIPHEDLLRLLALESQLRVLKAELRRIRSSGSDAEVYRALPHFRTLFRAITLRDLSRMSLALTTETADLMEEAKRMKSLAAPTEEAAASLEAATKRADAALETARVHAQRFQELAASRVRSDMGATTRDERAVASEAWASLRAMEEAREEIYARVMPSSQRYRRRLWLHGDVWNAMLDPKQGKLHRYFGNGPQPDEKIGTYLERVSKNFLTENDISLSVAGSANLPAGPSVYAVSHRCGAIDRFVTLSSLPLGADDYMYQVAGGSALDRIANEHFGPDNGTIVPISRDVGSAERAVESAVEGFAHGKKALITYPEGTPSTLGETRRVALSPVRVAYDAGVPVVAVVTRGVMEADPDDTSRVAVSIERPIDPRHLQDSLGITKVEAINLAQALLQFDLSSGHSVKL